MIDLMLLTPFSSETRHRLPPGFDQYSSVPSNVRAPPAHPANGLTRALTASKYSPLHCRDVVRSCLRSPRYFLTVRCIFEKLSGHKKLKNIAFVRDFEHFDNEIDFSGLKGWEDIEVDNVKPQETVSSLPLVTA